MLWIGHFLAEHIGGLRIVRTEHFAPAAHVGPRAGDGIHALHRDKGHGIAGGPALGTEIAGADIRRCETQSGRELIEVAHGTEAFGQLWNVKARAPAAMDRENRAADKTDLLCQHDLARGLTT